MPEHDPHQSWAKTALLATLVSLAVVSLILVLVAMGWWIPAAFLGVGALIFVVVWRHNPTWWYRRMAVVCIGIAAALPSIPHFILKADIVDRASIELMAGGPGKSISALCLLLAGLFAFLDYRMHAPRGTSSRTSQRASTGGMAASTSGVQSPTVGQGSVNYGVDADRVIALAEEKGALTEKLRTTEAENAELKKQLANALNRVGEDADEGDEEAKQAIAAARETGDLSKLQAVLVEHADRRGKEVLEAASDYLELCREIAAVAYIRGDIRRCEEWVLRVLALAPDDVHSLNLKGNLQRIRGRYSEARDTFAHMLGVASDKHSKAVARGGHALMEWRCHNLDNAVSEMTMAAEEFGDLNDSIGVAYCHGNISAIELQRGNLTLAEEHLEKCLKECVKRGDMAGQATSYMNLGIIALRRAQYSRADEMNKMAIKLARQSESAERVASCLGNQAAFYIETEQYHLAKPLIRESRDLCCQLENDQGLMYCDHQLAVIAWRERRIRDAEVLLDSVERVNAEVKDHEMEANCLAERGHIAWSRLEFAEARQLWTDAKGKFKAIQMTHEAQVVEGWLLQLPID